MFSTTADGASSPTERMRINSRGNISTGGVAAESGEGVRLQTALNANSSYSLVIRTPITPADSGTINYKSVYSRPTIANNTALGSIVHYWADQASVGTGATVDSAYGFYCSNNVALGTGINYGYFSNIAAGSGRWNFYANGTAANYFAGNTLFQSTGFSSITAGSVNAKSIVSSGIMNSSRDATTELTHYQFYNPNGLVGAIKTEGSQTKYEETSDYRLKENIAPLTGAVDQLKALKPCVYNFKTEPNTTLQGFIAHEAQEVCPQAVTGAPRMQPKQSARCLIGTARSARRTSLNRRS